MARRFWKEAESVLVEMELSDAPEKYMGDFSERYIKTRARIIKRYLHGGKSSLRMIVIAVVCAVAVLGAVSVGFIGSFSQHNGNIYPVITDEYRSAAPRSIEKRFSLELLRGNYSSEVLVDDEEEYWVNYRSGDDHFYVVQRTVEKYYSVLESMSGSAPRVEDFRFDGKEGVYCRRDGYNGFCVVLYKGYVFEYSGNIGKDRLIEAVRSTVL